MGRGHPEASSVAVSVGAGLVHLHVSRWMKYHASAPFLLVPAAARGLVLGSQYPGMT